MLPRARVRRSLDDRPEEPAVPWLKVRTFTECFERGRWQSPLLFEGRLNGSAYYVQVGSQQILLLETSIGSDRHGPFVLVQPQEHVIAPSIVLRVHVDANDGTLGHAAISYVEVPSDARARTELGYAERWFSVYFNPLGLVDGCASGGPESIAPPQTPS